MLFLDGVPLIDGPEGAERNYEIRDTLDDGAGSLTTGMTRGGTAGTLVQATSNLGLGAFNFHNINLFGGVVARCMNAIGVIMRLCPSLALEQAFTAAVDTLGLYRFETMLAWAGAVNYECGITMHPGDGTSTAPALITGAGTQPGIILENNNGAPRLFTRRDAATFESIPLVWPGPLTSWVAVRLEIRAASLFRPGSLRLYLNDVLQVERFWTGAHALPLLSGALATSRIHTAFIVRGGAAAPVYAMAAHHTRQILAKN